MNPQETIRKAPRKKLGEMLVAAHVIDELQLRAALGEQKKWGGRLGLHLIKLGFLSEEILVRHLATQLRIPIVDFTRFKIPPTVLSLVPAEVARRRHLLPLGLKADHGHQALFVAMSDPTDLEALDEVRFLTQFAVQPVAAQESTLDQALRFYYDGVGTPPYDEDAREPLPAFTAEAAPAPAPAPPSSAAAAPKEASPDLSTAVPPLGTSLADAKALSVVTTLVQLLVEKGYITRDELLRRLRS